MSVCDPKSTFLEPTEENIAKQGEKLSKIYLSLFMPLIGHGEISGKIRVETRLLVDRAKQVKTSQTERTG